MIDTRLSVRAHVCYRSIVNRPASAGVVASATVLPALVFSALVLSPILASAATLRVPADHATLAAAVAEAADLDTILVAPGTYTGDGNRDIDFIGKDLVVLSEAGAATTTINAGGSVWDPHRAFNLHSGETTASVIRGFTITGGHLSADVPEFGYLGAGIRAEGSSLTLEDCVLRSNYATPDFATAGAVGVRGNLVVRQCLFDHNEGGEGGGAIWARGGALLVEDSGFTLNDAFGIGGAVRTTSDAVFRNCTFTRNVAWIDAGAVDATGSLEMTGCRFESNGVALYGGGGGALVVNSLDATLTDCVFEGNSAEVGGAIRCRGPSLEASGCLFSGNAGDPFNGDAFGGAILFQGPGSQHITACRFENNIAGNFSFYEINSTGGAIGCTDGATPLIENCSFIGNRAEARRGIGSGGAVAARWGGSPVLSHCLFDRNSASDVGPSTNGFGGAIDAEGASVRLQQCTIYGSEAEGAGGAIHAGPGGEVTLASCIIAFGLSEPPVSCDGGSVTAGCTDIWGHPAGNWVGCIASEAGRDGNFEADPWFCDAPQGDFTLGSRSPCLPGHHPYGYDCGTVGAFGVGCTGPTRAEATSWGRVKRLYR